MRKNESNINDTAKKLARKVRVERVLLAAALILDIALMLAFAHAGITGEDVSGALVVFGILAASIIYLISSCTKRTIKKYMLDNYGFYRDHNGNTYTKR